MSLARSAPKTNFINLGILPLRSTAAAAGLPATIIVSGVGRSGTSMLSKVFAALGVPMGLTADDAVHEDQEFLQALIAFDYTRMDALIAARNQAHAVWGFKFPSLQNHLLPAQFMKFRNPHLVVVMRDPVAIAARSHVSDAERKSAADALRNVTGQMMDMMALIEKAGCPTLLISYEKFVSLPDASIEAMARFCGLSPEPAQLRAAHEAVAPNNAAYIELFHTRYRGHFDGVAHGHAIGWCASQTSEAPVIVEILADDVVVASATAGLFRKDLAAAGIGKGNHAFRIPVGTLKLPPETLLQARVAGGLFLLEGSNRRLAEMTAR